MPLILWIADSDTATFEQPGGDLWVWSDKKLRQLTTDAHITFPVLSPDGLEIAYSAYDKIGLDESKRISGEPGFALPTDISILNIATGQITSVASQPKDAAYSSSRPESQSNRYFLQSGPAWSPDGKKLAWTGVYVSGEESPVPGDGEPPDLAIFDLAHNRSDVTVSNFPRQTAAVPLPVIWSKAGIAVLSADFNFGANGRAANEQTILTYSPDNFPAWQAFAQVNGPSNFIWIKSGSHEYVSVAEYCLASGILTDPCNGGGDQWVMIKPTDGKLTIMSGPPELYSLTAPSGVSAALLDPSSGTRWRITWTNKAVTYLEGMEWSGRLPLPLIAISSDGKTIAYVNGNGNALVNDGDQITAIDSSAKVLGVIWGQMAWRVGHDAK